MSDALEKDLREALQQQAAMLDSDIRKRLLETDFRPRVHRYRVLTLRRGATLGGAAMIAAVAVVLALVASQGGRAPLVPVSQPSIPAAFVGWTAQPSRATATRIAIYAKRCRWAAAHKSHLGSPLIADVRGPYTALLFVDQRDNYERFCIYGPHVGGQGGSEIASLSPFTLRLAHPGPYGIEDQGWSGSCDPATRRAVGEMYGQVGADVVGATFLFRNHAKVLASVRRGFYLVWWPWGIGPMGITLETTQGTRHIKLRGHPSRKWC